MGRGGDGERERERRVLRLNRREARLLHFFFDNARPTLSSRLLAPLRNPRNCSSLLSLSRSLPFSFSFSRTSRRSKRISPLAQA